MSQTIQGELASAPARAGKQPQLLGHPRGLVTLFMTEMWERFTYYGMRALLVLFLTEAVTNGGFGINDQRANAIYRLYLCASFILCLPGGWIADRLIGARRAVRYGGMLIVLGNGLLALSTSPGTFFGGLIVIGAGVGLLKPNISAMVAELYPEGGVRRDAGFTLFYLGINLGAFLGPLVTGLLREYFGWRVAFSAGAVVMSVGLLQYHWTQHHLGDAGSHIGGSKHQPSAARRRQDWSIVAALCALICGAYLLVSSGVVEPDPLSLVRGTSAVLAAVVLGYFAYMLLLAELDTAERKRMVVLLFLFAGCALFWAGFEQTGPSLNLFAERYVDRMIGTFEIPTHWFQSLNSLFILVFAVPCSMLWIALARRNLDPSAPAKFAFGVILLGLGFLFMVMAANVVSRGEQAVPYLLALTYLLHTFGELCLSPVGLSYVTKLAPARFVSQMMGVWFIATAMGNLVSGLWAGTFDTDDVQALPGQFMNFVYLIVAAGLVLLMLSKPVNKLMGGVK
jgi:proton-dependent oligopeptide transporter, POT family